METVLGIRGPDFVMLAADTEFIMAIIAVKHNEMKIHKVADNLMIAAMGHVAERTRLVELVRKHVNLYSVRNGYTLSAKEAVHYIRRVVSSAMRTVKPYVVTALIAGYDVGDPPQLQFTDSMGNSKPLKYSAQGCGGVFCGGIMEESYRDNLTQNEAYCLLKLCVREIQKRLGINFPSFNVAVVNKDGITKLNQITKETLKRERFT